MLIKFKDHFLNKLDSLGRSELLYIVPTLDGIKLLALNFTLLVIGLVYANNYVLLFNFILFCLFLGSMFYTHFNLQGLKLISAKLNSIHMGENGLLTLQFKSKSNLGHHFLGLKLRNQIIQLSDKRFTFSLIATNPNTFTVDIPVRGISRGEESLNRVVIETLFPFHLFRCFLYFKPTLSIVVFPKRLDLGLHLTSIAAEEKINEGDDFILNDFKIGDPLKRVHWKKLAQTNRWYSKNLVTPNTRPVMLSLNDKNNPEFNLEDQLSSLAFAIYQLHFQNIKYGLSLGDLFLAPDHSNIHLNHCLHALAGYESRH